MLTSGQTGFGEEITQVVLIEVNFTHLFWSSEGLMSIVTYCVSLWSVEPWKASIAFGTLGPGKTWESIASGFSGVAPFTRNTNADLSWVSLHTRQARGT